MPNIYYLDGSVRGNCGHRHRSLRAAARCLREDQAGCEMQGGYSDRHLCLVGGWSTDDEWERTLREFDAYVSGELRA